MCNRKTAINRGKKQF